MRAYRDINYSLRIFTTNLTNKHEQEEYLTERTEDTVFTEGKKIRN